MRKFYILGMTILLIFSLCLTNIFAQDIREEREEKTEATKIMQTKPTQDYKFSSRINLFFGYDSNANLSPLKKGDFFEQFIYSFNFNKSLWEGIKFSLDYDFGVLNYQEYTDISNLLNHLRLELNKKFSLFRAGIGYDLDYFYYLHSDYDFLFHKGFFYLRQDFKKGLYHKLQLEYGYKDYLEIKALDNDLFTYQDNERQDKRYSVEYSLGIRPLPKLSFLFKTKFSSNDSNSRYLKFYDYKTYQGTFGFEYALLKNTTLVSNFIYRRKNYTGRIIISGENKQKDDLYVGNLGLRYKLNRQNALSLFYTYRNNHSNEDLDEYLEHVITAGWQYTF